MVVSERTDAPWLLLTFTLSSKRASQRVEVWRKLRRYGCVGLGNSGYLLPSSAANEERFQWLATAIRKYRGEASVVHVKSIDNLSRAQLIGRFAEARAREYQELIRELETLSSKNLVGKAASRLSRMRNRFRDIAEVDFFDSPLQKRVQKLLDQAARLLEAGKAGAPTSRINQKDYKGRIWVTRPRPGVDRCTSAWLIKRFIDRKAQFAFAPEDRVPSDAVPFDMFHKQGFGHRGDDCTFETLTKAFHIRDKTVQVLGQIVHDADLFDEKFGRKEGFGIDEVMKGWAKQDVADAQLLDRGMGLAEALYHSLRETNKA
jgi:hypothetical protein